MTTGESLGRLLVVDDEPMNRMVLQGVLGKAGYTVLHAANGREAVQVASTERLDLILLDVMMPGESGFDVCRKLKAMPATSHVPVIFVTCLGEISDKLAGLETGAVDYITKPFVAQEVVARVRAHMDFSSRQGAIIEAQASRLGQVQAAQQSLLVNPQNLPEARFAVHFLPVLEAGGDFYDVCPLGGEACAYLVADVSGHDLGASFITSSLKALFRQHAQPGKEPADILAEMNRILCAITPEEVYLTAACLRLDRAAGRFAVACAGHPPVLARLAGRVAWLELRALPLGLFEDAEFEQQEGAAAPGERFYLYTDGLAENSGMYATSQDFRQRMEHSAECCAELPLEGAVERLVQDLDSGAGAVDDVLVLGVEA